jgi:hypothetical protein
MNSWVRLPDESPRWFNLSHATDISIAWQGDLYGPRTYVVRAHYAVNLAVVLYRATSLDEAENWVENILGKDS